MIAKQQLQAPGSVPMNRPRAIRCTGMCNGPLQPAGAGYICFEKGKSHGRANHRQNDGRDRTHIAAALRSLENVPKVCPNNESTILVEFTCYRSSSRIRRIAVGIVPPAIFCVDIGKIKI
jgi:hypothetical protein